MPPTKPRVQVTLDSELAAAVAEFGECQRRALALFVTRRCVAPEAIRAERADKRKALEHLLRIAAGDDDGYDFAVSGAASCLPLSPSALADCLCSIPRRGTVSAIRPMLPRWLTTAESDLLAVCPVVALELLASARDEYKFADLDRTLSALPAAHVTRTAGAAALGASRECEASDASPRPIT